MVLICIREISLGKRRDALSPKFSHQDFGGLDSRARVMTACETLAVDTSTASVLH